jgi:L-fuculose-phosphate aldolase
MKTAEREMIRWGRLLFERRLISGWGGNLSCRLGPDEYLITGRHAPLGFLTHEDLVRINSAGAPLDAKRHASSETLMHLAVYAGTDAQAVVHAHPPMVVAFSLVHDSFAPVSFEEKYTIGEVSIIAQDTPTATEPAKIVEELRYHSVAIIKAHGTVAIGKDFQEAFLLTDLLEEAVRCQFAYQSAALSRGRDAPAAARAPKPAAAADGRGYALFSPEHMAKLVERANDDAEFRAYGSATQLSTSLTLCLEETGTAWTVRFAAGEITGCEPGGGGDFVISGKAEWWKAVFSNRIDPFFATQQGKLRLERGELAQLSRWYKPFQRAFSLWQTVPVQ